MVECEFKWALGSITMNKTSGFELVQILKVMLLECCTQYVSKFGKLSNGYRIGKRQFSFQSQRRAMPKNVQTTVELYSFHMLARLGSKSFKLGFSSTWTENFQIFKVGFKEAEEPNIKLPTCTGSWRKQASSRKNIYFYSTDYVKVFDCVDHNRLWKILKEMGIPDHFTCLLRNLYAGQEATVRTRHETTDWFKIGKGVSQGCILTPCISHEYFMWNANLDESLACLGLKSR